MSTTQQFGSTRGPIDAQGFPSSFPGAKILVTGITGISGSHIALALARSGYKVHGTTRSQKKADSFTQKWPDAKISWTIIPDQTAKGAYDGAVVGCEGVVHCAGPFNYKHTVAQEMIEPSVEGVLSVFRAAAKESTVRRVIHISSVAAIHQHSSDNFDADWSGVTYDETNYNYHSPELAVGEKNHDRQYAYTCSKKMAELAAQKWLQENEHMFDVVTFCPSTNYGPLVQPINGLADLDTASNRLYQYVLDAKNALPKNPYPAFTAVKDLAQIVVRAYTTPIASGQRYQITSGYYNYAQLFSILKEAFPEEAYRFPEIPNGGLPLQPHFKVDVSKAERDFGVINWSTIEQAIIPEFNDLLIAESKSKLSKS